MQNLAAANCFPGHKEHYGTILVEYRFILRSGHRFKVEKMRLIIG
jgi:hypothetical protein